MASQLGTGKALGTVTGAEDASRLIGGTPQMGAGTPIGGRSFDLPALSPAARPVDTFFQSRGPILGGATVIPRPPDLPQPSGDMAALAKSLGSFSETLGRFGDTYVAMEKMRQEKASIVGEQINRDLQAKFPGQTFADVRDQLYRQATAGDSEARALYERLQALSPLQLAYTNRYNARAFTLNTLNTASSRFALINKIGDTPRDEILPGDPRVLSAISSLVSIPDDPVLRKELLPLIEAKYGELNREHNADVVAANARKAESARQKNYTSLFGATKIDRAAVVATLSQQNTDARQQLGIPQYQKLIESTDEDIVAAVMTNSIGPDGKLNRERFNYLSGEALQIYSQITVGPEGTKLIDQLGAKGGPSALIRLSEKLMSAYAGYNEKTEYFEKEAGKEQGQNIVIQYRVGDPSLTPAQRQQAEADATAYVLKNVPIDQQASALAQINNAGAAGRTISAAEQARVARENVFSYAKNPRTEIPRIQSLVASGLMDPATGRSLIANYEELLKADMKPFTNAAAKVRKDLMDDEIALTVLQNSPGGQTVTREEEARLIQRGVEIDQRLESIRRSGLANKLTPAQMMQQVQGFAIEQRKETEAAPTKQAVQQELQAPKYVSPEAWFNKLKIVERTGRGNPQQNQQLADQVKANVLFSKDVFDKNFNDYLDNGRISPQMQLMIKRAGYGNNPVQFFLDQFKMVHPGVPFPKGYEKRIQQLQGQKISSAQPSAGGSSLGLAMVNPDIGLAQRLSRRILGLTESALNAIVPSASAREMPLATMGPMAVGSTSLLGAIRALRGANSFRGTTQIRFKQAGDYQSDPRENFFFDFNPRVVPLALSRAGKLSPQDLNALTFTVLTEAGPTAAGKFEVAANLINRSAVAGNKPIVDIAKAPGQYEGVFGYTRQQVVSAAEGRRIFGSRYDQLRKLLQKGI